MATGITKARGSFVGALKIPRGDRKGQGCILDQAVSS
jgi:hypothetical protein